MNQIFFFKVKPNENIKGHTDCQEKVTHCHGWNKPNSQHYPQLHWVPDDAIEHWLLEFYRGIRFLIDVKIDLSKPKQIKVIYRKC